MSHNGPSHDHPAARPEITNAGVLVALAWRAHYGWDDPIDAYVRNEAGELVRRGWDADAAVRFVMEGGTANVSYIAR